MSTDRVDLFQTKETPIDYYGDKGILTARYGMKYLKGNTLPYFSLTGEVCSLTNRDLGGGALHTTIGKALHTTIGKALPELKPLVKWHLTDQDGTPLHYTANAMYWFDCFHGRYPKREADTNYKEMFHQTVVFRAVEEDSHYTVEKLFQEEPFVLEAWLKGRLPALQKAFHQEMKGFEIEYLYKNLEGYQNRPIQQKNL